MPSCARGRRVHTGVEGAALQSLLPTKEGDEEGDEQSTSVYDGRGLTAFEMKVDIQQSTVGGMPPDLSRKARSRRCIRQNGKSGGRRKK